MGFTKDFVWGVATASYQIEGAAFEDGKGLSVWDVFCRRSGKIWSGHTGEIACDHYHRYQEDIALMRELGVKAYRFSISWPRVLPEGIGSVNQKGLDFYHRLVDALMAAGITPYVTLFHWDLPYALNCRGGWVSPESPDWFAEYTQVMVDALSDRVKHWITMNETACFIGLALQDGKFAPGEVRDLSEVLQAAHHTLLAHGQAVRVIRERAKGKVKVGLAVTGNNKIPATNQPEDIEAAREALFQTATRDCWNHGCWLDPVFLGRYPEDAALIYGSAMPQVKPGDMEIISAPLDFCGLNLYFAESVRRNPETGKPETVPFPPGTPVTATKLRVTPEMMYWVPKFMWERYQIPVIITENGLSNADWVSLDGQVHDPQRIDFLTRHLKELRRAAEDGVSVEGYFHWSFMDNFEWTEGYKERFGLVYVDYGTQKRIPKDSAYWYRDVMRSNEGEL